MDPTLASSVASKIIRISQDFMFNIVKTTLSLFASDVQFFRYGMSQEADGPFGRIMRYRYRRNTRRHPLVVVVKNLTKIVNDVKISGRALISVIKSPLEFIDTEVFSLTGC